MKCVPLIAASMLLASCEQGRLTGPPEVLQGRTECAECGMLINEDRCCSGILVEREGRREALAFDDFGCQIIAERDRAAEFSVVERWVKDYDTRQWVEAGVASFLYPAGVRTPMNTGIVAFADAESARRLAESSGGNVLGLEAVMTEYRAAFEAMYGKP